MLQKELAKRLKARYDTEMAATNGWKYPRTASPSAG